MPQLWCSNYRLTLVDFDLPEHARPSVRPSTLINFINFEVG